MIFRLLVPVLVFLLVVPSGLRAQEHVVASRDLRNELQSAAGDRENHISKIQQFLQTGEAQRALRSAHVDPARAQQAVSMLSDAELARLAAQVDRADFAGAGLSLTTQQVTIILVGIILIIVVAIIASR
ncbi:MAG TPA: PA2779 family protein [Bryobacteraceae bacterium]